MAAVKPGFITGANARIKLGGKTLAYCTDLNFTVDVATIPIEVIGTYEVKSYEPVAYAVNGSFAVVRYTAKDSTKVNASAAGNAADKIGGGAGAGSTVGSHLNPGQILTSSTFDMEIQQATGQATNGLDSAADLTSTFKIQDCRIVRRGSSVNKRGVMVDSYQFVGVLAGDVDVAAGNEAKTSGTKDLA